MISKVVDIPLFNTIKKFLLFTVTCENNNKIIRLMKEGIFL
jgi:hypothetical protein